MTPREKWNVVHEYRNLIALDAVPPINCPECDGELIPVVDKDDSPALRCLACRVLTHIGLHVYDQMQVNIADFKKTIRTNDVR